MIGWRKAIFKTENYYVATMYPSSTGAMFAVMKADRFKCDEDFFWHFAKHDRYAYGNTCEELCDGVVCYSRYLELTKTPEKPKTENTDEKKKYVFLGLENYDATLEARKIDSVSVHCVMFKEDVGGAAAKEINNMFKTIISKSWPGAEFESNVPLEEGQTSKFIKITEINYKPFAALALMAAIDADSSVKKPHKGKGY